ncbi:MAG: DNA internalization-related competence protein ComEC/Rec2 [Propionibacteriaceae bacterium]|nr:DNA internalization-related competence protein ComEC/Rec2 [Propionibacteriaceae bacterium]
MSASDRFDARLAPAAATTWAGMWLIIASERGAPVVASAAVVVGVVAWRRRTAALALVAVVLGVTALVGGLRTGLMASGPIPALAAEKAVGQAEVTVTSVALVGDPQAALVRATLTGLTARGQEHATRLPVLLFSPRGQTAIWAALTPGDRVTFSVRLAPAEREDAAAAVLQPRSPPVVVAPSSGWRAAVEHVRAGLRQAVSGARPEQAALLPALVVGDTSGVSATLKEDFQTTGLTHLTAVSGANLTILLAFLLGALRRVGVRGRVLDVAAVAGVAGFVVLCHSEPSVLRAAAMGLVGLAALSRSARPGAGLRQLCVAVVALTWIDPWLSHSAGFALSALACLGLLLWARPWTDRLSGWLPVWAAEAVAVPLAAQLMTQPLVSYLSGSVSLAGLVANALAAPFVAPATVAGLVTALVAVVSAFVGRLVGTVSVWLVEPILQIAHRAARLPGAAHPWPVTPVALVALGATCVALAWALPRLLARPALAVGAAVVLVVALLRPPFQPGWPPDGWVVAACDVGQGDAVVVRVADRQALLLDTGPPDAGLVGCLSALGVRAVPVVVLSHLHLDHVGGLQELLARYPVGTIIVGQAEQARAGQLAAARAAAVDIVAHPVGAVLTLGEATIEIMAASRPAAHAADAEESSAENDASLVVRVTSGGVSILATGDLETAGQAAALAARPDLEADVLKVPHHGSGRQDPAFLAASAAQIALVCVGQDNAYGHPAAKTVSQLTALGMTVARTDEHGAIAIARAEDGRLQITSER